MVYLRPSRYVHPTRTASKCYPVAKAGLRPEKEINT